MISIAILMIVTAIGIPGYTSYVRNGSRDNTVTNLYSNINYARSEALKLNTDVILCRTGNAATSTPTCGGSAQNWTTGWLVYADMDGSQTFNTGDKLLKVGEPIKNGIQVKTNSNADADIVYGSDGSLSSPANAVFAICDNRDGTYNKDYGRQITISAMGRPEITSTKNSSCAP